MFHMKQFSLICLGLGISVLAGFAQNPKPATGHRTKARPMPSIKATGPRHALIAPDPKPGTKTGVDDQLNKLERDTAKSAGTKSKDQSNKTAHAGAPKSNDTRAARKALNFSHQTPPGVSKANQGSQPSSRTRPVYGGGLAPALVRLPSFAGCQFLASFLDLCRLRRRFDGFHRLLDGIFQQAPLGPHSIFPSNFLSFFIGATPVTDADLVDSQSPFSNFDRDFRLEPKAILFDRDGLNHLPAKCLITGLHITEVDISEAVGKQSQNPVSYRVPEVQHAMGSAAKETRPINHISFALYERGKQCGIVLRIVFEIRVLNDHEITGSFLYPTPKRRTLTHVARLQKHPQVWVLGL